jgi:hypothetical protein
MMEAGAKSFLDRHTSLFRDDLRHIPERLVA